MFTRKPVPARAPVELSTSPAHHPNNPYAQQPPYPTSPAPNRAPPPVPPSQRDEDDYFEVQPKPEAEAESPEEKDWWDESDPEDDLIETHPPLKAQKTGRAKSAKNSVDDNNMHETPASSPPAALRVGHASATQSTSNGTGGAGDLANLSIQDNPEMPAHDLRSYTRFGQAPGTSLNKVEMENPANAWAEPVPKIDVSAVGPPYPISPQPADSQVAASRNQWQASAPLSSQILLSSSQPPTVSMPTEDPWRDETQSSTVEKVPPVPQKQSMHVPQVANSAQPIDPWRDQAQPITNNKRASTSAQAFDAATVAATDPWNEEPSRGPTKLASGEVTPPALPQRRSSGPETPRTKAKRQRNEFYQVKSIRWYDHQTRQTRNSSILIQNANGPCPLLALVNALVLTTPPGETTALVEALSYREQVSLGLLLDAVFDELTSGRRGDVEQDLPDIGDLYSFLITLHTGMNVNPRFIDSNEADQNSATAHPGTFEMTREMRLYSTFGIPLIHGWLPRQGDEAFCAFQRQKAAQSYEDAQNMQFHAEELEAKLHAEGLTDEEQDIFTDVIAIREFATAYPTQLSDYGLEVFKQWIKPGQTVILFRNDHFSTLYKQPDNGRLLTLVTDAGYATHDEIVWESLADVNGMHSELFSGDFRSVDHSIGSPSRNDDGGEWQTVKAKNSRNTQTENTINEQAGSSFPAATPRDTEQEDHDLALALQLQEEEEARYRGHAADRARENAASERFLSQQQQQQQQQRQSPVIEISQQQLRAPRQGPRRASQQEQPPPQPPRPARASVSRPADDNDEDAAPPPYSPRPAEGSKPYRPPLANPTSAYSQSRQSVYTPNAQPQAPSSPMSPPTGRRESRLASSSGPPGKPQGYSSNVNAAQTDRGEDKCAVM